MKKLLKIFFLLILFNSKSIFANTQWILDKNLSEIKFELSVLLGDNVYGEFTEFAGYISTDIENKNNYKSIFSVNLKSIEFNYKKYKELLLSDIFFDETNYPIAIIDTKKFSLSDKVNNFDIQAELQIKNIVHFIPLNVEIIKLANELIQIKAEMNFSRNLYELGQGSWSPTLFLHDKIEVKANLFLVKK